MLSLGGSSDPQSRSPDSWEFPSPASCVRECPDSWSTVWKNGAASSESRDPEESKRLNAQHAFLVDVIGGTPIHPSIPTANIRSIADAATGTGSLKAQRHEIQLTVQDILQPFPQEHRGRYDLVHVRLLVGALKEVDYPRAVRNLYDLLKPGGYLQWDDCDTTAFCTDDPTPIDMEMRQIVVDAVEKLGLCGYAPQYLHQLAAQTGFVDARLYANSTADKPHLRGPARTWLMQVLRALMPHAMIKSGEVVDEKKAIERAERLVEEFGRHCTAALPLVNLYVLVARKPVRPRSGCCTIM
ncbi:hypothetical protein EMGR_004340 [Emarellia grisea]